MAVLISGGGRTLLNLHDRIVSGELDAHIEVVVSSRQGVPGVACSRQRGLHTEVLDREDILSEAVHERIDELVDNVDLVCMAGFLSLWRIPARFEGRVINIHPALLPDFGGSGMYGRRVHEAVLSSGQSESGCTVHFCDNEYDHGPIILQRRVSVYPNDTADTLASRIFQEECIAYPQAIRMISERGIPPCA